MSIDCSAACGTLLWDWPRRPLVGADYFISDRNSPSPEEMVVRLSQVETSILFYSEIEAHSSMILSMLGSEDLFRT